MYIFSVLLLFTPIVMFANPVSISLGEFLFGQLLVVLIAICVTVPIEFPVLYYSFKKSDVTASFITKKNIFWVVALAHFVSYPIFFILFNFVFDSVAYGLVLSEIVVCLIEFYIYKLFINKRIGLGNSHMSNTRLASSVILANFISLIIGTSIMFTLPMFL